MVRNKSFEEGVHIEEILLEANAFGMKREVDEWAKKLLGDDPEISELVAYELAFHKYVKEKESKKIPCEMDHNGECLVCGCWIADCAFNRWLNNDYKWESKEELDNMFEDYNKKNYENYLHGFNN